jgi:large conductance mechanosensitive channel
MTQTKKTKATAKIIKAAEDIVIADGNVIIEAGKTQINGFMNFIRTQGVVGLAVGLVLGGAVTVLVTSLVNNVVMPPLGLLLGSADGLKGLSWTIGTTPDGTATVLHYGTFLNDLINFLVIAFVVYMIVSLLKLDKFDKKKEK